MGLELYAKVEHLLGFEDEVAGLYKIFLDAILKVAPKGARILDIGCGSGRFCAMLMDAGYEVVGIDLSSAMVERAKANGVNAYNIRLESLDMGSFDVITAVFDVLNYLDKESLTEFLSNVGLRLNDNGYFFADINSYYGFNDVAQGVLSVQNESESVIVDAEFDGNALHTTFTLFSLQDGGLYKKECDSITQYYHKSELFKNIVNLKLHKKQPLRLFGEKADKEFLTFVRI